MVSVLEMIEHPIEVVSVFQNGREVLSIFQNGIPLMVLLGPAITASIVDLCNANHVVTGTSLTYQQ